MRREERGERNKESEEIQARKRSLKKTPRHLIGDGVFFQCASFTRIIPKQIWKTPPPYR